MEEGEKFMNHTVVIDNQEIPLDAETAASDQEIRQALRWCYPEIANATINRRTEGEREIITVVKRAGTKGISDVAGENAGGSGENEISASHQTCEAIVAALVATPEEINGAVQLAIELQTKIAANEMTLTELTLKRAEMQKALEAGEAEEAFVEQARARLAAAPAHSSYSVPIGF